MVTRMTKQEKIIVSAYTGYLMCDFNDMQRYVEERLGRPVWTHEFGLHEVQEEIRKAVKPDFLALCQQEVKDGTTT